MEFPTIQSQAKYILACDPARMGKDASGFIVLEKLKNSDVVYVKYIDTTNNTKLTETIGRILYLHSYFNFTKIYLDSTGMGSGLTDVLKEKLGNGVVEEIVFTRNSKAEMFFNLKILMQQGKLKIPNYITNNDTMCKKLYMQFLEIQQEYNSNSDIPKIFHTLNAHDDLVCALALACLYFKVGRGRRGYSIAGF